MFQCIRNEGNTVTMHTEDKLQHMKSEGKLEWLLKWEYGFWESWLGVWPGRNFKHDFELSPGQGEEECSPRESQPSCL